MFGCYTFSVVEYVNLGRKLGRGTRVAARILRDQAQNAAEAARTKNPDAKPAPPMPEQASADKRSIGPSPTGQRPLVERPAVRRALTPPVAPRAVTRNVARGSRSFARGFWRPFAHAVRALWHEITGVFFAIFALFFAQGLWRTRHAWLSGPEHRHFAIYLAITALFVYFSISAFVSSRRSPH